MTSDRSESGFTLVEVTLATVITGLIIGAIATALVVMLNSYPSSANRLAQSDNAQLLSAWLLPDVQSASGSDAPPVPGLPGIDTTQLQGGTVRGCNQPVPTSTSILTLTWSDADKGNLFVADYRLVGTQLIRYYCHGNPLSLVSETVVGRDIASANANPTLDSVAVHVQTTKAIADSTTCPPAPTESCYSFDVVASRRTPALRIWTQPVINIIYVDAWSHRLPIPPGNTPPDISGTAEPTTNNLKLTITDQTTTLTFTNIGNNNGIWSLWNSPSLKFKWPGGGDLDELPWTTFNNRGVLRYTITGTDPQTGRAVSATTTTWIDTSAPSASPDVGAPTNTPTTSPMPPVSGPPIATPSTALPTPPLNFTIRFSSPVTDLTANGVNVTVCTASKVCPPPGDTPTWSINKLDSSDFVVAVNGLDTTDDAGDGIVQVTVKQGAVTDLISGNPNRTSVLPPIVWDAHSAPTVSGDGYPTSDSSIQYLVTFPPLAASTKVLASDFTATSSAVDPKSVLQTACPSGTVTGYQCFKVSVVVSGAPPSPQQISLSVNDGTAGKVLDQWGLPIPGSVSPANVTWTNTPLTIIPKATQGSGSAIFSGLASTAPGDGPTVSVDLCTDMKCSSPVSIGPPIPTGPGASWTSPAVPTAPNSTYWARVTQTLAGNPTIVMTGPFQT